MNSRQHRASRTHTGTKPEIRRRRRGFTLAEVVLAMTVFTMMILMFAAVFPMAVRGAQYSSNYAQGAMLAQHKMDSFARPGTASCSVTAAGQP